jgi:hypothetical protein
MGHPAAGSISSLPTTLRAKKVGSSWRSAAALAVIRWCRTVEDVLAEKICRKIPTSHKGRARHGAAASGAKKPNLAAKNAARLGHPWELGG